jgi:putative ABC transport system permease protein
MAIQLRSVYRGILRNQGIVFINVSGFAVAMTCCILIFLYMADEHAYDRHHTNADRIARICLDRIYPERNVMWATVPPGVRDGLIAEFPEIETVTRIRKEDFSVSTDRLKGFDETIVAVDDSFFDVFDHEFIKGNSDALSKPASVVITKRMAEKYFETVDAIGKSITLGEAGLFNVSGVIADLPSASHIHYDFIISFAWDKMTDFNVWNNNFGYYTYALLNNESSVPSLEEKLPSMSKKYLSGSEGEEAYNKWRSEGNDYRFFVQPLPDIHLHSNLKWEAEVNGNAMYVMIFMGVGLLVLAMAIVNFVNLATARYSVRAKEVGIRKVLGSLRRQLVIQFMIESLVLCSIAIVIALILTEISLPSLNMMLGKDLFIDYSNPFVILSLCTTAIFVGALSGVYPAIMLSSFQPAVVLRSKVTTRLHSGFRNRLVVFQFVISFFLVSGTWIVFSQLQYIQSKDLGMTKDNILVIDGARYISNRSVFKNALMQERNVVSVACSADIPGKADGAATYRPKGFLAEQELNMTVMGIDTGTLKTWGIELADGRDFVSSDYADTNRYVILNETAVKQLGWPDDPIGRELLDGRNRTLRVAGVVKDFHLETLRKEIRPLLLLPTQDWVNKISIRLNAGDPTEVITAAEKLWKQTVVDRPFVYFFMDDYYNSLYRSEQTTGKLFVILTTMAIMIAALGLLGLSAFMAERRTREIGIRKVVGASTGGIIWLMIEDLSKLVLIGILIGIPLTSLAMTSWLNNFAYRMNISFMPYLAAGILSLSIAVATVLYHAAKAARVNPVDSLRVQ